MTPSTEIRYITPDGRATFDFMALLLALYSTTEALTDIPEHADDAAAAAAGLAVGSIYRTGSVLKVRVA